MKAVPTANASETRHDVLRLEIRDHAVQRHVRKPVCVVGEEHGLTANVLAYLQQALADVRVQPRVDECDAPVMGVRSMQVDPATAFREGEVVRDALVVIEEIVLDEIAA